MKCKGISGKKGNGTEAKNFLTSHPKTRITLKKLIFLDHCNLPLDRAVISKHTKNAA